MRQRYSAVFLSLLGVIASPLFAQDPQASGDSSAARPFEPIVVQSLNGVKTSSWTELNERVTVVIAGLHEWTSTGKNDPDDLRLFLEGRMLPKTEPAMINRVQNYVTFMLDIDPARPGFVGRNTIGGTQSRRSQGCDQRRRQRYQAAI